MDKKKKSPVAAYAKTSAMMYVYSIIFSLPGMIFVAVDKIPSWVTLIMGFLFGAPICALFLLSGKREGEQLYKTVTKGTLTTIHDKAPVRIPLYKSVYHVLGFAAPLILLVVIAAAARVQFLQAVVAMFILVPPTLIFAGAKLIDLTAAIGPALLYVLLPYILLVCGLFIGGFVYSIGKMRRRQGEIESELRSFDN